MVKMTESNTRRRVKVYTLNDERQWDDRGTGHVSSSYVERLKGMTLIVRAEQDGTLLLESRILPDTAYQKQQETLIVWSEGENTDLALSFQEKAGCDEIWEKICSVQGKDPSVDITQDIAEDGEDEDELTGSRLDDSSDSLQRQSTSPYVLPACELGELDEISDLFAVSLPSVVRRDQLARAIEESDYITKLLLLFHTCEDLENKDGLHRLYEIMKGVFLLNRSGLFDVLLQEKNIMDVVGCLEYDPALPAPRKHREYLLREVNFKEVLPIQNPDLKKKIHQTFRLQYIQDVVLPTPSVFEENMLSTLSSLIFFNKVEIVNLVQDDPSLLSTIFKQLRDDTTPDEKRCDLAGFIRELCSLSQTLQPTARDLFFRQLGNLGILQAIETLLAGDHHPSHRIAIDVFAHVVEHSPSMVRDFAHHEMSEVRAESNGEDDTFILNLVIEQMICDPDPELSCAMQLTGLLRVLLDPENMMANKNEKTEFLGFFYKNCMHVLMAPLLANTADEKKPGKDDYQTANMLSLILELVTFSVEHHTYHVKNYVLNKDLLRRVLVLLNSRHSFLALSALRFMRKIISTIDEFYNRYIIKGNLFQPIVNILFLSGRRYNLLNSAILEMFEFIRVEDIKSLTHHIVEKHYDQLKSVAYVKTFSGLKLRYDQQKSRENHKTALAEESIVRNHRFRRDPRSLEEEEELWFEKDDEDPSLVFGDSFDTETAKINIDSILEKDKPIVRKIEPLKPISEAIDTDTKAKQQPEAPANGINTPSENKSPPPNPIIKNGLIGLVDYSDDESEEDDENQSTETSSEAKNLATKINSTEDVQKPKENNSFVKNSVTKNGAENNKKVELKTGTIKEEAKLNLEEATKINNKPSSEAAVFNAKSNELKIKPDSLLEEKKVFNSDDEPARKKPRLLETIVDN